ncbi:uncharacterized protein LOC126737558 [Anthonomus grandis grandis]|uniref:uncharacterized protein LOC126737558 n=1 Tax=Anthonomus grandis grandis TaxID=2921223 RepID=UPI0021655F75|nr:uncharacterized protein LOC126737558 [Anthonomus grandis grandis]
MVDSQVSPVTEVFPNTQESHENQPTAVEESFISPTTTSQRKRKSIPKERGAAVVEEIKKGRIERTKLMKELLDLILKHCFFRFPNDPTTRLQWTHFCKLSAEDNEEISKLRICSLHFKPDDYIEPNAKSKGRRMVFKGAAVPSTFQPSSSSLKASASPLPLPTVSQESGIDQTCNTEGNISQFPTVLQPSGLQAKPMEQCDMNKDDKENRGNTEGNTSQFPTVLQQLLSGLQAQQLMEQCDMNKELDENREANTPILRKKRKFAEPRFISEIRIPDVATPRKARRVLTLVRETDRKKSRKIKNLQDKNRYLLKKTASLEELVSHLQKRGFMTEEAGNTLLVNIKKISDILYA